MFLGSVHANKNITQDRFNIFFTFRVYDTVIDSFFVFLQYNLEDTLKNKCRYSIPSLQRYKIISIILYFDTMIVFFCIL